jgi:hypothetical protein
MSRPKPKILFHFTDKEYKCEEILQSEAVYAVCFDSEPINLRSRNKMNYNTVLGKEYPGPKYKKTSFTNPGHAFNLAERLNILFKTDKFAVHQMIMGPVVTETGR